MSQAHLVTERLDLVPPAEEHLPFLAEFNADTVVQRFLFQRGLTAAETEERLRSALVEASGGLGRWVGVSAGEPIGLWGLSPPHGPSQPKTPGGAGLGYRLPQRTLL